MTASFFRFRRLSRRRRRRVCFFVADIFIEGNSGFETHSPILFYFAKVKKNMSSHEEKNRLRLTPPQIIFTVAMVGIIALLAYNAYNRYTTSFHRCDKIVGLREKADCCNNIFTRSKCNKATTCEYKNDMCESLFGYNKPDRI